MTVSASNEGVAISLNRMVLVISVVFLIVTVGLIFVTSAVIKEKAIKDLAGDDGRKTSLLVFETLYAGMRKGWDRNELQETIERLNQANTGLKINVVRGEPVIRQFGGGEPDLARQPDPVLDQALRGGRETLVRLDDAHLRYVYPMVVRQECLS